MEPGRARSLLGLAAGADRATIRAAYRRRVARVHPDVSRSPDATDRTLELRIALEVLLGATPTEGEGAGPPVEPPAPEERSPAPPPVLVERRSEDTIGVALPPDEVLLLLIEVAHDLGEVAYLDPANGLIEVVVEFLEAPTSSVLLHLQGRATGVTEIVCTVEPLSGGARPPTEAVTELLRRTIVSALAEPGSSAAEPVPPG
ncbi:MAG: DnaJ domain-containing protein [Microthrixaceae bacterium]|jgi:hypothetical protein